MLGVLTYPSHVLFVLSVFYVFVVDSKELPTLDIEKLAKITQGTELLLLESSHPKSYRLEDFFWTGSGDGNDENYWESNKPSTVYKTTTVLSTIFIETPSTYVNQSVAENTTKCTANCNPSVTSENEIQPTPTYDPDVPTTTEDAFSEADRQFWLLTVLKSDGKDPVILDLKNSLVKLYRTAFHRQQEIHLGINQRTKRQTTNTNNKPVSVYIHNVEKSKSNGEEKIQVLYHVTVSGKPVDAITAAADMTLVSDEEVTQELGIPFLIKAEPYLKPEPLVMQGSKNTWMFIGVALAVLFILLLMVALLTMGMSKKNTKAQTKAEIGEKEGGSDNKAFIHTEIERPIPKGYKSGRRRPSPTYINFRNQSSNQTLRTGVNFSRPGSSLSSMSSSSSSLDISPIMTINKREKTPRKPPRPKAALNKTVPIGANELKLDSDSSSDRTRKGSSETILIKNYDPGVVSPKSYLSMPSVKSFPRSNMPEPLNKVLEPVTVLHLDMPDDGNYYENEDNFNRPKSGLVRYGSVGAVEDPGVIGPVVWSMHCQRLQHGVSMDEGINEKIVNNASRMRKRFHELLDETFSLFGSRRDSSEETKDRALPVEMKSHSAIDSRPGGMVQPKLRPRPKTSDPRRVIPSPNSEPPRRAWGSNAPTPLLRPFSAGVIPQIDVEHVLARGNLPQNDPAVPLIAAIKTELGKCSLPGSTTNLHE